MVQQQQVKFSFHNMRSKGFTLIELMIYIAISSIVLLGAIRYGFVLLDDQIKYQALADVQYDHQHVLELIVDHVHRGASIGAGTVYGTSTGTLQIVYVNAPTTTFSIVEEEITNRNGTSTIHSLQLQREGSAPVVLTANDVTVSNFKLTDLSGNTTPAMYIDLTIDAVNITGDPRYDATHTWGTTAILRARY